MSIVSIDGDNCLCRMESAESTIFLAAGSQIMAVAKSRYKQNRLQQLRGFCNAARTKSISRAAEKLLLSQPSVSLQIKALERELGAQLFLLHAPPPPPPSAAGPPPPRAGKRSRGPKPPFRPPASRPPGAS